MIRKVMHLVRTVEQTEEINAIVEATVIETLNAIAPANLWSLFVSQEVLPVVLEEQDEGVDIYLGEYDSDKHADLLLVDVTVPAPAIPKCKNRSRSLPEQHQNTIYMAVTLTRHVEFYDVIRAIVQGPSLDSILEMDTDDLWWNSTNSGVPVEKAEHWELKFDVEYVIYDPKKHLDLPFVTLPEVMNFESGLSMLEGSATWTPSAVANQKDKLESERVGDLVNAEANQCYFNARKVIRSLPDYFEAFYVEGFIVTENGGCFEHGWIVKDGQIIDPTLPRGDDYYFSGLEFAGQDGIRKFLLTQIGEEKTNRPFHQLLGWNPGIECQNFLQAFKTAMRYLASDFGERAVEDAFSVRTEKKLPWTDEWR